MKKNFLWVVSGCVVVFCALLFSQSVPQENLKDKAIKAFSGKRAFEYLEKQVALGPRYPGAHGHLVCKVFLEEELRKFSQDVRTQNFKFTEKSKKIKKKYKLQNLSATFSRGQGNPILIGAHWDTRRHATEEVLPQKKHLPVPGANDGASGTAVLLELARVFQKHPPPNHVTLAFFDAEDQGEVRNWPFCVGSDYFAKRLDIQYKSVIIVDMIGDKNQEIYKEQNSLKYAPQLVEKIWSLAGGMKITSFKNSAKYSIFDDHVAFLQRGMQAVDLIDFDYPYWHTTEDTPDKCSAKSLKNVGNVLISFVY